MKCPNCKLHNPPGTMRCDCGYDFATGEIHAISKIAHPRPKNSKRSSVPAFYIFDQNEQRGPFEARQIAAMYKQGLLTANAQYYDERTQEWRSASELASPISTSLKRIPEEMKRPKSEEDKRRERKIAMWVYPTIIIGALFLAMVWLKACPG